MCVRAKKTYEQSPGNVLVDGYDLPLEAFWKAFSKMERGFRLGDTQFRGVKCKLWTGQLNADGYGMFSVQHLNTTYVFKSHRLAIVFEAGEFEPGLVTDHLCGNRACGEFLHLEKTTQAENARRGQTNSWTAERRTKQSLKTKKFNETLWTPEHRAHIAKTQAASWTPERRADLARRNKERALRARK